MVHNLKEPEDCFSHWASKLQAYDYVISHCPSSKHQNTDELSKLPDIHALIDELEELYFYLINQELIHKNPDVQKTIMHLRKDTHLKESKLFKLILGNYRL